METADVYIKNFGNNAEGVTIFKGKKLFVEGAIPQDVVRVGITTNKNNYCVGKIDSILQPSPYRVEPRCSVFDVCGGCQLQNCEYNVQLSYKHKKVFDMLAEGGFNCDALLEADDGVVGMDNPWRYRNKAIYPLGYNYNGKPIAGFYAKGTHKIISSPDCVLSPIEFGKIISIILDFIYENKITIYNETTHVGLVRNVLIRKAYSTNEILVCIVCTDENFPKSNLLVEKLKAIDGFSTLVLNINKQDGNVIIGEKCITLYGTGCITDVLGGLKFKITPLSFYQINSFQAEYIYNKVIEYSQLTAHDEVWDICCGIGTISLFLAKIASKVHGLEVVEQAITLARENACLNDIRNVDFVAMAAEDYFLKNKNVKADVVVVDPPRSGLKLNVVDSICFSGAKKIVYVSCNPGSLVRDGLLIEKNGFKLTRFQCVDQFCHTAHIETVALFEKK